MYKLLFCLCLLNLCSVSFYFVTLLSNEWFRIQTVKTECAQRKISLSCLILENMTSKASLKLGIWFICPKTYSLTTSSLGWVISDNVFNACFHMFPIQLVPKKISNNSLSFLAKHLNDKHILDMKPQNIFLIQLFCLIGLFLQLLAAIISITAFIYLLVKFDSEHNFEMKNLINFVFYLAKEEVTVENRSQNIDLKKQLPQNFTILHDAFNKLNRKRKINMLRESAKYHLIRRYSIVIMLLLLLSLITRFTSFCKFSIYNYLDYLFRKSYSIEFQADYFNGSYDSLISEILSKKFIVRKSWPVWVCLLSLLIDLLNFLFLIVYSFSNELSFLHLKRQLERSGSQLNRNNYSSCSKTQNKVNQLVLDALSTHLPCKKELTDEKTLQSLKSNEELYEIISNYTNEANETSKFRFNFNQLIIREKIFKF